MQRLSVVAAALATLAVTGCLPHVTQHASSNFGPMREQFPYRAKEPLARELRYTYTSLSVLNGKPDRKPTFGADSVTLANPSTAPRPAAVVASVAGGPKFNAADTLSRFGVTMSARAREMSKQGADKELVSGAQGIAAASHGAAASMQAATASLEGAQATAGLALQVFGLFEELAKAWAYNTTRTLGEWVRESTGTIGPSAPPGTVLQCDFIFVLNGEKWHTESRVDFLARATLIDGQGRKLESSKGYQLYTIGDKPRVTVPADAIPLGRDRFSAEAQPLVKKLQSDDVWDPYLAVAMTAALADLELQVRARRAGR